LVHATDVAALEARLLASGLSVADLVFTAQLHARTPPRATVRAGGLRVAAWTRSWSSIGSTLSDDPPSTTA